MNAPDLADRDTHLPQPTLNGVSDHNRSYPQLMFIVKVTWNVASLTKCSVSHLTSKRTRKMVRFGNCRRFRTKRQGGESNLWLL
jgi:hypothetical protein